MTHHVTQDAGRVFLDLTGVPGTFCRSVFDAASTIPGVVAVAATSHARDEHGAGAAAALGAEACGADTGFLRLVFRHG